MSPLSFPLTSADVARIVADSVPGPATGGHGGPLARTDLPTTIAIGAFDGMHLGHRALIGACRDEAARCGGRSVLVMFDPDPSEVLAPTSFEPRLLAIRDRVAYAWALGLDDVMVIPFDRQLASREPEDFMALVTDSLGTLVSVHVGSNFRFGRYGRGTPETLAAMGAREGYGVRAHGLLDRGDAPVSSTRIRGLLAQGRVAEAAGLLGRHHFVRGKVTHGRGEGTSFGFPTANLSCDPRACMPGEGVYACLVTDGERAWPAAVNVGAPPTFSGPLDAFLEANLIGFSGDLYGRELAVVFLAWLRASRGFSSVEELERVVRGNIAWVREHVGDSCVEVSP